MAVDLDARIVEVLARAPVTLDGGSRLSLAELSHLATRSPIDRFFTRILEITVAATVLIVGAPFWLLLALCIRLDSPGPVLYRSRRAGRDGKPFAFLKFRTMRLDADSETQDRERRERRQAIIRGQREAAWRLGDHPLIKDGADPRITALGRWLRPTGFDEIPQLWHVLTGEMSLVGPRPYPLDETGVLSPWQRLRLRGKPGVTGLWQVSGRSLLSFEDSVLLDIYYLSNASFFLDLKIIAVTPWRMLTGLGGF